MKIFNYNQVSHGHVLSSVFFGGCCCSLRNNMFELADRLVGIYKTDNCTKSITINPGSFVVCEQAAA